MNPTTVRNESHYSGTNGEALLFGQRKVDYRAFSCTFPSDVLKG